MKLQDYLLKIAAKPGAFWVVMLLTFCESVFLFVPAEVFMTPPIVAKRKNALPIVVAASVGSLLGGAAAYLIGAYLFESVGLWLIDAFSSLERFAMARDLFFKHGIFIIFAAAFTPVPYKLMCLAAGFLGYNPLLFLGLSAVFRTGRFAFAGWLLWRFQEQAHSIVKKYFWPLTFGAIALAVLGLFIFI
jgi:membrane protein YqaA with SNARE-associated domain